MDLTLWLLTTLAIKHFICDFPLQATPYMYANKGAYNHPGGYVHAGIHATATWLVLVILFQVDAYPAWQLSVLEFFTHYVIDFSKVNISKKLDLKPNNSEWFWILLGFDQLLHTLTYIAISYLVVHHG